MLQSSQIVNPESPIVWRSWRDTIPRHLFDTAGSGTRQTDVFSLHHRTEFGAYKFGKLFFSALCQLSYAGARARVWT
jgi:hypothetical protein